MDAVPLSAGYELRSPHTFAVLLSILYTATERVSAKCRSRPSSSGDSPESAPLIASGSSTSPPWQRIADAFRFRLDLCPIAALLAIETGRSYASDCIAGAVSADKARFRLRWLR